MIGAIVGALRADLGTNVAQFNRDMGSAGDSVDRFTGRAKRSSRELGKAGGGLEALLGGARIAAASAAAAGIFLIGKASLDAAGEVQQLDGALEGTFGDLGDEMERWAERTGDALGRSTTQLKKFGLEFGQVFTEAADTTKNAAILSKRFAELAIDVGAFFEVSDDEALNALNMGLLGNMKGLKKFGILITENEVSQKALALGLAATTAELSEQDKVIARAALIMEKTRKVTGDAAGETNSWEGQIKRLNAQIREWAEGIGKTLMPIATAFLKLLNDLMQATGEFFSTFDDGVKVLQLHAAQLTGNQAEVKRLVEEWKAAQVQMDKADVAVGDVTEALHSQDQAIDSSALKKLEKDYQAAQDAALKFSMQVRDFGISDLDASTQVMTKVSDSFNDMSKQLRDQVQDWQDAEGGAARYADQIGVVQELLARLVVKYDQAAAASENLFLAQQAAAKAGLDAALGGMGAQTDALRRARGDLGTQTDNQKAITDGERDLAQERLEGLERVRSLEQERAQAIMDNDGAEAMRLEQLIASQTEYNALVEQTTAKQLLGQQMLEEMVAEWFDITKSTMADLFKGLRDSGKDFDFKEWGANFIRNLSDSVLERKAEQLTETLFGFLGIGKKSQEVDTITARSLMIMGGGLAGGNILGGFGGNGGPGNAPAAQGPASWLQSGLGFLQKTFGGFFKEGGNLRPHEWGVAGEGGNAELIRGGMHGATVSPLDDMSWGGGDQIFNITTPNPDGFRASKRQIGQMARREFR